MITRAILSLLKHNNRVNLPTLGAIIKQQDFSQSVFFNQFIKYDDGVLSEYLTKIEMLTEEESHAKIHDFIETIRQSTQRDGKFEIKELGIFCFVDNRLELLSEKEYARMLALSHARALSEMQEQANTEHDHANKTTDPEKENEKLTANECDVGHETSSSSPFAGHSEIASEEFETLEEVPQPATISIESPKLRNSSVHLKFIRVGIPLIVVGLILIRVSLPIPGSHQNSAVAIDSSGLAPADSISHSTSTRVGSPQSQPTPVPRSSETILEEPVLKGDKNGLVYHVIIGAFRFESNADKLVAEQFIRGHAVSKLGKRNGYYLVSYESTTDVWMAKKICNDLKAFYPEVWLDKQE